MATKSELQEELFTACTFGYIDRVKQALQEGACPNPFPNAADPDSKILPMQIAMCNSYPEAVKLLIEHKADLNVFPPDSVAGSSTPFDYALINNNHHDVSCAAVLIELGCDIKDDYFERALKVRTDFWVHKRLLDAFKARGVGLQSGSTEVVLLSRTYSVNVTEKSVIFNLDDTFRYQACSGGHDCTMEGTYTRIGDKIEVQETKDGIPVGEKFTVFLWNNGNILEWKEVEFHDRKDTVEIKGR